MNPRRISIFAVGFLCLGNGAAGDGRRPGSRRPWWDDFPRIVECRSVADAVRLHAAVALCGCADDPTWGIFGQRQRIAAFGDRIRACHAAGIRTMAWFEAFGTAGSCYVAQLKRTKRGGWVRYPSAPTLTRVFHQHWNWQNFDGTGVIRWIGIHDYFDDADFARPYTRTHPRYGCPPLTYPDGRPAAGYAGPAADPRNSRVYDAGCAKDVFGQVEFSCEFNPKVNARDPATGRPHGPLAGLLKVGAKYAGLVSPGKDSACPVWIDYVRASVRQALDAGIDSLWCDNYSAWDSFGAHPIRKAFGDWSVAGFRTYLATHFSAARRARMGIGNLREFDVRRYLRAKCRAFGGRPHPVDAARGGTLRDPFDAARVSHRDRAWRDPRWLDDPVWRAYLIYKRRTGERALRAYYRAIKREAAAAGRRDFAVCGNDIPVMSLGWVRGELDMVSTELAWGWGLASGPRGFMPPPEGSYIPVYKLAREHARSRFVNVWMYVPKAQWHKPGITEVLYYQGLANHTLPMPHVGNPRTVGSEESAAAFFQFVRRITPIFGARREVDRIGLYFSSSSQLMSFTPGGFRDFNEQRHMFAHWGWGTALVRLHRQYRAVPEWKLTPAGLRGLQLLIIPNAIVFPRGSVAVLRAWVRAGGRLIVTGDAGERAGETENFRISTPRVLAEFTGVPGRPENPASKWTLRRMGKGRVLYIPRPIGLAFYRASEARASLLGAFRRALERAGAGIPDRPRVDAGNLPWTVNLTTYEDPDAGRFFIDLANTNIRLQTDTVTPVPAVHFRVTLPDFLQDRPLAVRTVSPQPGVEAAVVRDDRRTATVRVTSFRVYAAVVLSAGEKER